MMKPPAPHTLRRPDHQGSFRTDDDLSLFEQSWRPETQPRAVVALVHGFAEHSSRYGHVADRLVRHGYAVFTYDQRGYGRSEGRRAFVASFDEYVHDLGHFLGRVADREPGRPLFLLGHSMGGIVAALHASRRGDELAGLILSSPAVCPPQASSPLLFHLARWIGRFFPTLPTVKLHREKISRDPAVVEEARSDHLNYQGRIPARTGAELLRAAQEALRGTATIHTPLLLLHGTDDGLADVEGSYLLYRYARSTDKTLELYEGLYHETFNEPERNQVLDDLTRWLNEHV